MMVMVLRGSFLGDGGFFDGKGCRVVVRSFWCFAGWLFCGCLDFGLGCWCIDTVLRSGVVVITGGFAVLGMGAFVLGFTLYALLCWGVGEFWFELMICVITYDSFLL